jgi:small subunit ribosomal protein S6
MRRYETFVIIDPDLSPDERGSLTSRVGELINQMDGFLVLTDDWGERKLAYDIKKKGRGYYVRFDYCGLAPLVNEIERFFRIDDRALKYMTVLLNKQIDLEKIKAEKAAMETAAAEQTAGEADSAEHPNVIENAPKEDLENLEENAKTDADIPSPSTDDPAVEKPQTSAIEEA